MNFFKNPITALIILTGLFGVGYIVEPKVLSADETQVDAETQLDGVIQELELLSTTISTPVVAMNDSGGEIPEHVTAFFSKNCIECHGPYKSKGKITLHDIGSLPKGQSLELWADIQDVLEAGEMPPEEEPQPKEQDREAMVKWITQGLHQANGQMVAQEPNPGTRRLSNFEYQNTMRDLFGYELNLIEDLPEDPVKPYHFNNTAEFMLLGPEQVDIYLKNARRALTGAIVDPGKPKVYRHQWTYGATSPVFNGIPNDEVGVYAGGRNTVSDGAVFSEWPETGEYRIRIRAGAILPPGYTEVPLRLVMGTALKSDSGTGIHAPVGTISLSNDTDHLEEFEFRGRIENHPIHVGLVDDHGNIPQSRYIYPQNLFDNGRLNDFRENHMQTQYQWSLPRAVIRSIEFEAPVIDVWPPEHHTRIFFESTLAKDDPKYIREVIERFVSRAFRRSATAAEIDQFVRMYELLKPSHDTVEATMRETLSMVLIAPQFLYHTSTAEGVVTPQYEMASRLSYFLWGTMPDEELLSLAAQGSLNRAEVIETQVKRMLADKRANDFVRNFTIQWLSIQKSRAVAINQKLFPRFLFTNPNGERAGTETLFIPTVRDAMLDETVGFIGELIQRNGSVFQIVDSDFAMLNERLAAHYGVEGVKGYKLRPVPIKPEHNLGGLLTQGSVLIGNSTGTAPHPIYRAVWLREAILGDEVAPPPANIPDLSQTAGESVADAVSIKDMLRIHRTKTSCNDCHFRLDPWGIPFEEYNAIGQYQPMVSKPGQHVGRFRQAEHESMEKYQKYLESVYIVKVDSKTRLPSGEDVNGMRQLKNYLLEKRKKNIVDNVIKRLFAYGIGRNIDTRDHQAVEAIRHQTAKTDHGFQDLIIAICKSETFQIPNSNPKDKKNEKQ